MTGIAPKCPGNMRKKTDNEQKTTEKSEIRMETEKINLNDNFYFFFFVIFAVKIIWEVSRKRICLIS